MAKRLTIAFPEKCIGCELCVLETQRQLKLVGLEGALIRIFRSKKDDKAFLEYSISMDPHVNELNIEKIKKICPTGVFEISETAQGDDHDGLTS